MLTVNFQSRTPVYQQLYDDVIRLSAVGILTENSQLPPVRSLAAHLGVNPNTVRKAYEMLEADGYIYSTLEKGSFVSEKLGKDKAETIKAKQELEQSVSNAYKKGVSGEEIYYIVKKVISGGIKDD